MRLKKLLQTHFSMAGKLSTIRRARNGPAQVNSRTRRGLNGLAIARSVSLRSL